MSNPSDGGAAFPNEYQSQRDWGYGLTIRDYFAAKAIRIWLEDSDLEAPFVDVDEDYIAKKAYKMADAMLKARQSKAKV